MRCPTGSGSSSSYETAAVCGRGVAVGPAAATWTTGLPHDRGGPTCGCNLAPLCRKHHRAKTHTPWTYQRLGTGVYLWTTPHGRRYLRDTIGTRELDNGTCPHAGADPPET